MQAAAVGTGETPELPRGPAARGKERGNRKASDAGGNESLRREPAFRTGRVLKRWRRRYCFQVRGSRVEALQGQKRMGKAPDEEVP